MKKTFILLLSLMLLASCKENKQKKLIGTWGTIALQDDWYSEDSILCHEFIEFTKTGDQYFLYEPGNGEWKFLILGKKDSINYDMYKLTSGNEIEVQLPEQAKKALKIKKNPIYTRTSRDIKPNKLIFDLLYNFREYKSPMSIDTLGDGTIRYELEMQEGKGKSTLELGNLVKYFLDKQIGALPKEEEEGHYSRWEKAIANIYTWENLNTKLIMECYFKDKDSIGNIVIHANDYIQVKLWQNVK